MKKDSKVLVAGAKGLVGSAIVRRLKKGGYENILTPPHSELELCSETAVNNYFEENKPEYVFLAAAKVGGILANSTYPADFITDNLRIALNLITAAHRFKTSKFLFLGSSCIYPKHAKQPIPESELLTGYLEPTNKAYAVSKIAGLIMCESFNKQYGTDFISAMPTNLFGPGDNYHPDNSHVIPGLIRRVHEAKVKNAKDVTIWGSGAPLREFLYSDDLADACVFLMENYSGNDIVNIGSDSEMSIKELANTIKSVVGFEGELKFDYSKPDGTPRKRLDSSKIRSLGWAPTTEFKAGLGLSYRDFVERHA